MPFTPENWIPSIKSYVRYTSSSDFKFLNRHKRFHNGIEWDYLGNGLLWTYHLNYFEYLVQPGMDSNTGYGLIDDFLSQYEKLISGHDPYPISLRLIFWIRFFIEQNEIPEMKYLRSLHEQACELQSKLEFHLLGNHLLENAFALVMTGTYLGDQKMTDHAYALLIEQLEEQILEDGGHFELSPMYHQLMLYRLLDVINMMRACSLGISQKSRIEKLARKMLGWMQQMTFSNGGFPLLNDAAYGIAPSPREISEYASRLGITPDLHPLSLSGYRKWTGRNWEMFLDVGNPGPKYQPGHAHCDMLSFVLNVEGIQVFVDTGVSVYGEDSKIRQKERSTAAHNTVQIENLEQSEIWSDFRMARKAKVSILEETSALLSAVHNGFYFKKDIHCRTFRNEEKSVKIEDKIRREDVQATARFHLHPGIHIYPVSSSCFSFGFGTISFDQRAVVNLFEYEYAPEFGITESATGIEVQFQDKLITEITFSSH